MRKRITGNANRKARIFVGLLLLALICIQCVPSAQNIYEGKATAINTTESQEQMLKRLRELARTDHIKVLEECRDYYLKNYGDFECNFVKQERIHGKVGPEQEMHVKFRHSPYSVAMAWTRNAPLGDRVLFIEGQFDNQMLVRPSGAIARKLFPTLAKDPNGEEALQSTLRPVNLFGVERSLQSLIEVYKHAKGAGDLRMECDPDRDFDVAGRKTFVLIRWLPEGKDYPAAKTLIYIDQQTFLPVLVEGFAQNGDFICAYLYKDVNLNVKWKDEDFLPERNDLKSPQK